jgi:diacylglycerol kinase (CTP)
MTIPPNDAFTLTSHSDTTPSLRSSRSRSLTRSPSPKIAFMPSQHVTNNDVKRRSSRRQRKSSGFVSESAKLADVDEALERALNGNGNGHANGIIHHVKTIAPTAQVKKIDWEIPRKVLHSSMGMSRDSIVYMARPPVVRLTDTFISGFLTIYLYASHGSPQRVIIALSSSLLIVVPADILRLNCPPFERAYEAVVGFLMRESEKVRHKHTPRLPPPLFRTLINFCLSWLCRIIAMV